MSLGEHLLFLRARDALGRSQVSANTSITAEHLRNVEADKSRPSPELVQRLLALYDTDVFDEAKAWLLLAEAILPPEVLARVELTAKHPPPKESS